MVRSIIAIERDGFNIRTISMQFDVPREDFDIIGTLKRICLDYVRTEDGRQVYEYNCGYFNLADIEANIPDSLYEEYGIKRLSTDLSDIVIDWDEDFVDDDLIDDSEG